MEKTRIILSALVQLSRQEDKVTFALKCKLEWIIKKHNQESAINEDKCHSVECLLEILCQLRNGIDISSHLDILTKDNFLWHSLAKGLSHVDGLTRKRANYLLKRFIDSPINCKEESSFMMSLVPFLDSKHYQQTIKIWNDFFIVIETLEEKQVHLVKQVFNRINQLLSKVPENIENLCSTKPLNIVWILVIYKLLFQHQNQAIVRWSLHNFLINFSGAFLTDDNFVSFMCSTFLNTLNSNKHFVYSGISNISCEMEALISGFLSRLVPEKGMDNIENVHRMFWNRFLTGVLSISWGPLPLFHVTKSIADVLSHGDKSGKR